MLAGLFYGLLFLELDADGVDAVAFASRLIGSVIEDVTEVAAAFFARDFNTVHAERVVFYVFDGVFVTLEE